MPTYNPQFPPYPVLDPLTERSLLELHFQGHPVLPQAADLDPDAFLQS